MLSLSELVRIYVCLQADRHAEEFRFLGRRGAGGLGLRSALGPSVRVPQSPRRSGESCCGGTATG